MSLFFNGQKKVLNLNALFDCKHTHKTQREPAHSLLLLLSMASSSSLRADQLRMKGLQLDDVSMKKLELDMREEVMNIFELQMQIFYRG